MNNLIVQEHVLILAGAISKANHHIFPVINQVEDFEFHAHCEVCQADLTIVVNPMNPYMSGMFGSAALAECAATSEQWRRVLAGKSDLEEELRDVGYVIYERGPDTVH